MTSTVSTETPITEHQEMQAKRANASGTALAFVRRFSNAS
jgi:hypothetical protein